MPKTQEWIKEKLAEDGWVEYGNRRLTEEVEDLKQRVSDLELVIEELMKRGVVVVVDHLQENVLVGTHFQKLSINKD